MPRMLPVKPQEFSMWLRKRAWVIALVLTAIGTGIILPITTRGFGLWLLWVIPVEWLIFFIMLRSTAKFLPDMFFPSEK